jgi:nicotinamidase-related amidase
MTIPASSPATLPALVPASTALILIDLQNAIVGRELAPHPAATVVRNGRKLAEAFRQAGAMVVYVRVDLATAYQPDGDEPPMRPPGAPPPPAAASEIAAEAGFQPGDLLITKRQWGAFYGTELDLFLRRRQISTIVLGGIATNFGVESTARDAAERGFRLIFPEDAMSSMSAEAHAFALKVVFRRLGKIRSTDAVLQALAPPA